MYLGFTFYYVKKGGGKQLLKSHIIKLLQLFTLLPFSESIVNMVYKGQKISRGFVSNQLDGPPNRSNTRSLYFVFATSQSAGIHCDGEIFVRD